MSAEAASTEASIEGSIKDPALFTAIKQFIEEQTESLSRKFDTRIGDLEKRIDTLEKRTASNRKEFVDQFEDFRAAYLIPAGRAQPSMFAERRPRRMGRSLID